MGRKPTAWYWKARKCWAVDLDGSRYKLGPEKDAALRELYRLLSLTPEERKPKVEAPVSPGGMTVAELLDKYLDWCQKHRAPRTYDWYKEHLDDFASHLPNAAEMPFAELKPYHVVEWADKHPSWGDNYRRGALIAVARPGNWAVKLGYIPMSPIAHLEKPQATRREQAVTLEEWEAIRNHYDEGDPFRDILEFMHETGCRPQEAKAVEARHVELDKQRIVFPAKEAKGKKRVRIVYMTPRAEEIIRNLLKERKNGILFLNTKGRPWNYESMNCRFITLQKHLGVKYCAYAIRHGFATRKLEEGLNDATVAALMGHRDTAMLGRVYSHVGDRPEYLREQLNRGNAKKGA
jgi:integrase/recombinase XerC